MAKLGTYHFKRLFETAVGIALKCRLNTAASWLSFIYWPRYLVKAWPTPHLLPITTNNTTAHSHSQLAPRGLTPARSRTRAITRTRIALTTYYCLLLPAPPLPIREPPFVPTFIIHGTMVTTKPLHIPLRVLICRCSWLPGTYFC